MTGRAESKKNLKKITAKLQFLSLKKVTFSSLLDLESASYDLVVLTLTVSKRCPDQLTPVPTSNLTVSNLLLLLHLVGAVLVC